ncbi:SHOCT domain-containing protein [Oscillospiraceae bacterium OttesenSCG-928-F05]|nr:SHOCT domain-containing protein [Oscillospiraceae bacterium OttesenSCG-928-F05]
MLAVTVFQYYYDEKLSARKNAKNVSVDAPPSTADEILKFKNLLDSGAITQEEYEKSKKRLLTSMAGAGTDTQ